MSNLIVYGAQWCAYCHQLTKQLDKAGVEYDYRDTDNEDVKQEMLSKTDGNFLIPTVDNHGTVMQNPDAKAIAGIIQDNK